MPQWMQVKLAFIDGAVLANENSLYFSFDQIIAVKGKRRGGINIHLLNFSCFLAIPGFLLEIHP
jgi:hypothetical protein